jgi:hypothetical protein
MTAPLAHRDLIVEDERDLVIALEDGPRSAGYVG